MRAGRNLVPSQRSGFSSGRLVALAALAFFGGLACRERCPPPQTTSGSASPKLARDPASAAAKYEEARLLLERHLLEEGLRKLEEALAADPEHVDSRLLKAWVLWRTAQLDEAAEILEPLRSKLPGERRVLRQLGLVLVDQGRFEEALGLFEALSAEDFRGHANLRLSRAEALLGAGRLEEAAMAVTSSLAEDPWDSKAYHLLSRIDLRRGLERQAIVWGERYRAEEPSMDAEQIALAHERLGDRAASLAVRGRALRQSGRWYQAMEQLNDAIRLDPGYLPAYLELARLSADLERPDDALRVLRTLPERPEVLGAVGDVLLAAERFDEAASAYRKAAESGGDWNEKAELAKSLSVRGPADDPLSAARREARTAMRGKPLSRSAADLLKLARSCAELGDRARARAISLFVAEFAPKAIEAWLAVADHWDRPHDTFVRIWALKRARALAGGGESADAIQQRLEAEWRALNISSLAQRGSS